MLWSIAVALILSLTCLNLLEARHVKHLHNPSSSVVVGTVYCDTCFQDDFSRTSHFISDATVAVECKDSTGTSPIFRQEAQTNKQGEFKIQLPVSISKHAKKIEGCRVKLIKSSEPYCAVASTAASSPLHLKTKDAKTRVFSAGFFTFKPLKQPDLCNQVPSITNSKPLKKNLDSMKILEGLPNPGTILPAVPLPIPDPSSGVPSVLPPGTSIPQIPLIPQIPPLPQIPPIPLVPGIPAVNPGIPAGGGRAISTEGNSEVQKNGVEQPNQVVERPQIFGLLPPILPSPPPAISIPLPPNPLQPAPLLPPLPFQPPPAAPSVGLPPLVPVPGLTPPAGPPPTSGGLPFPPLIPGVPLPPLTPGLPLPPVTPGLPLPPVIPGLPLPPVIPGVPLPPARSSSAEKASTP